MLSEITAFEFNIENIVSKFKISQNKSQEDQLSIIKHLENNNNSILIHDIMKMYYERK